MYVITGSTGNTGKRIAHALLAAGKPVKVIGRSAEKLAELTAAGAVAAIGDVHDRHFLTEAFRGATAVYLMIPPNFAVTDWPAFMREISDNYLAALRESGVKKAVLLSSLGAHLTTGAGPVSGLARFEVALRDVPSLDVLSLRPGFFMENFYALVGMIQHMGIIGYSLSPDLRMPIIHTRDIAEVAAKRLLALDFSGHSHVFIGGPADLTMPEVAAILGQGIGKPGLNYVQFSQADAKAGMMQNGLPETIADGYNELFDALNSGNYMDGYARTPEVTTPTTLAWFAENEFKHAFGG